MRCKSILLSAVALFVFILCGSTVVADINDGLISHWRFDEGSGAIAYDSAGSNDGTVHGAQWTSGLLGGALDFDGVNDYVEIPDDPSLDITDELTINAWVKYNKQTETGPRDIVWSARRWRYSLRRQDDIYMFIIYDTTTSLWQIAETKDITFDKDTWYHLVGTYRNGDKVKIYVNGTLNNEISISTITLNPQTEYIRIGVAQGLGLGAEWFDGAIDDVRIYGRALFAGEIEQLYQVDSPDVVSLEISGPNEVAENFSAGYKAIAYYDDDSTRDVTYSALWVVEPNIYASIETGALTTKDIIKDELATIRATYTAGDVTFEAEKIVHIFAICPTGTALSFDGVDDYVVVNDDPILSPINITLAAWIYPEDVEHRFQIIGKWYSPNNDYVFDNKNNNDALRFGADIGGTWTEIWSDDAVLTAGTWQHVVVTWDGSTCTFYINGENVGQDSSYSGDLSDYDNHVYIGSSHGGARSIDGIIDEVRIYDRALSAEEIRTSMHMRLAGVEPGLVGYWDFDESMGQVAYDLSGNGNNGQLGSTPDVDFSDPAWIESDAPIGRCTPYLIAAGSIKNALKHKKASLEKLEAALAEEWTAYEALDALLESGDYGDLKKGDIITARQRIHSAIQHQEQAKNTLEKSINQLEDALIELGYEAMPMPTQ